MTITHNTATQHIHLEYGTDVKRLFAEARRKVKNVYSTLVREPEDEGNTEYLIGGYAALGNLGISLAGDLTADDANAALMLACIAVHDRLRHDAQMGKLSEALRILAKVAVVAIFEELLPSATKAFRRGDASKTVIKCYQKIRSRKSEDAAFLAVSDAYDLWLALDKSGNKNDNLGRLKLMLGAQVLLYDMAVRALRITPMP